MKNSAGEECIIKFLRSKEGFHSVKIEDSPSEYTPLIGSHSLEFRFCPVIAEAYAKSWELIGQYDFILISLPIPFLYLISR